MTHRIRFRSKNRRVLASSLLALVLILSAAGPASAQEEEPYPEKLKGEQSWEKLVNIPGKILFFPFWLIDQAVKPALSLVGVFPQVSSKLRKWLISADGKRGLLPTFESRTGVGLRFFQRDLAGSSAEFNLITRLGLRGRQYSDLSLRGLRLGGPLVLDSSLFYQFYPDEPFFGIGNATTTDTRSNFAMRTLALTAAFGLDLWRRAELKAEFGYRRVRVTEGRHPGYPSASDLFPMETGARDGLRDTLHLAGLQLRYRLDTADRPGNPSRGWAIALGGGLSRQVNGSRYGYWRSDADITRYIHLFHDRTLVLRAAAAWMKPWGQREIPFFALSELGRKETIRGFPRGRFRDRNMLMGSLEYRYPVMKRDVFNLGVDAFYFVDFGQVGPGRLGDFAFRRFHLGVGGGLRLYSSKELILKAMVGKSRDGWRFYIMFF